MSKYVFDRPDPNARERERVRLAQEAVSGDYSADTYKARLAAERAQRPVTTPEERAAAKAFNRSWKRRKHRGYRCTTPDCPCIHVFAEPMPCYECRKRTAPKRRRVTATKEPQRITVDTLRPSTNRNAALL